MLIFNNVDHKNLQKSLIRKMTVKLWSPKILLQSQRNIGLWLVISSQYKPLIGWYMLHLNTITLVSLFFTKNWSVKRGYHLIFSDRLLPLQHIMRQDIFLPIVFHAKKILYVLWHITYHQATNLYKYHHCCKKYELILAAQRCKEPLRT